MKTYRTIAGVISFLFLLIFVDNVLGCSCLPPQTVLDEFVTTENVIVAKLQGFEEIDRSVEGTNVYRTYVAIFKVEKVYKGNFKEEQTFRVFNGGGGDCTAGFTRKEIDQKFLLYFGGVDSKRKLPKNTYIVGLCSRSKPLGTAEADLLYLDNRLAREGQTRFSGKVAAYGENISLPSVANLSVTLKKNTFHRELKTNVNGFFEIWDLPPGTYDVSIQSPTGWKTEGIRSSPAKGYGGWAKPNGSPVRVEIVSGKHTEISSYFVISNEISGKVISPTGEPMKGVLVSAYWLSPTSDTYRIPHEYTDEKGEFSIPNLPPGKYRIEINNRGNITASNPFETFYYPGVDKKEDAAVVSVGEGVSVRDIVIKVGKTLPLIKISGQLTYKNGKPVPNEDIRFVPQDDSKYEKVDVETDERGQFIFELPLGAKGELKANTNIWVSQFEKCEEALALRKTRKGRSADIQTNVVTIDGKLKMENVKLTYPLACP